MEVHNLVSPKEDYAPLHAAPLHNVGERSDMGCKEDPHGVENEISLPRRGISASTATLIFFALKVLREIFFAPKKTRGSHERRLCTYISTPPHLCTVGASHFSLQYVHLRLYIKDVKKKMHHVSAKT